MNHTKYLALLAGCSFVAACENPVEHRTERFVDHVDRNAGVGIDVGRAGDEGVLVTFGDVFEDVRNRGVAHRQRDALFGALLLGRRSPDSAA